VGCALMTLELIVWFVHSVNLAIHGSAK
jgi:hypothetical protein